MSASVRLLGYRIRLGGYRAAVECANVVKSIYIIR